MDGADALMRTLVESGITTLFTNPGTTELHLVEAAEATGGLRSVLGLFEGVVSGAADGYGRIAGRPAAVPGPPRARRRPARLPAAGVLSRAGRGTARRRQPRPAGRGARAGGDGLRLSGPAELTGTR